MLVLSVFSSKGGAGKSTVVANLAATALMNKERVGIIDLDPQRSMCAWRDLRPTGNIAVRDCAPSDLARCLETERRRGLFDLVLLDPPPGENSAGANAIKYADIVLTPARPGAFDLLALSKSFEMIRRERKRFGVILNAAPPLRDGVEAPLVRQARTSLIELGARLWRHQITQRMVLVYAAANGLGVAEYEPNGSSAREFQQLWQSIRKEAEDLVIAS